MVESPEFSTFCLEKEFWFVTVFPIYLNFTAFSKDLFICLYITISSEFCVRGMYVHFVFVVHIFRLICFPTSNRASVYIFISCLTLNQHILCPRKANIACRSSHQYEPWRGFHQNIRNLYSNTFNRSADNRNCLKMATVYRCR